MNFQFVENNKIDGAARKLIRSHVMKGKNVGKMRPRTAHKRQDEVPFSHDSCVASLSLGMSCKSTEGSDDKIISIPQTIGNSLSFFTFPCQMQPYMRDHIYQFLSITHQAAFPVEFCLPDNVMKSIWFQYLMSDEAFFHSVLAMSEVCVDSLLGKHETSPLALQHLSNAYRCIKRNLQTHIIPSDSTIASVMSMVIHEDLRGQSGRSRIHMNALQRMVEIRGGITQFRANRALCMKLCRVDIEYALQNGSHPHFNRNEFPREMISCMLIQVFPQSELFNSPDVAHVYDPELRCVIADLISVSHLLNGNHTCFKLEPYTFQEIWISVSYRLLHQYPLAGCRPEKESDNAWHLGLLALITTFLFRNGRSQPLSYDLLAETLRDVIQAMSVNNLVEEATFLWLLFISGISVFGTIDRTWLLPPIKTCLTNLNINSWRTARDKIRRFPWIDVVHDKPGHELWQAVVVE